jgi:hypothetical protein
MFRMQEHGIKNTENLQSNDYHKTMINMPLKCGDHVKSELQKEGPFTGVTSTTCASVESVENMSESKMNADSGRSNFRNKNTVSLTRSGRYDLRSFSSEKWKKLTNNIALIRSLHTFEGDEIRNLSHNSDKTPLKSCINEHKRSYHGKHLSKHVNSRRSRVQENSVEQLSKSFTNPEILKRVGSEKESKKNGKLQKSCHNTAYLEDGNEANCSVSCIKSTTEPSREFGSVRGVQFISNMDMHYKEKVQNKEFSEDLYYRDSQRRVLRKEALLQNITYIRPCYVKLVKLEHIAQQPKISPCKINSRLSRKASAVHLRGSNSLSCKAQENEISRSLYRGVIDPEGCKVLHSSDRKSKLKPRRTVSRQMKTCYSSSIGGARDSRMIRKSVIKQTCVSVVSNMAQCVRTQTETSGNIKSSGSNILFLNMTSEQFPSNVACDRIKGFVDHEKIDLSPVSLAPTRAIKENQFDKAAIRGRSNAVSKTRNKSNGNVPKTAVQESELGRNVSGSRNKMLHIQEQYGTNCVQIEQRKEPRRKCKGHKRKKLLNNLQPNKFSVLGEMKPFSICLERLDQSVLEQYSVTLCSKTTPQKNIGLLHQEVTSTSNKAESYSDIHSKHLARSGNDIHCQDKIPCMDGTFDSSSSDDCPESISNDHFEQSRKSPVTKKPRRQEKRIQESEKKLTGSQHGNADYSNICVLVGTSLQKPGFESPAENLNWRSTTSSSESHSPVRSPRKSLYPPLAIKIQKSPKKRTAVTEKMFEVGSDLSSLIDISNPDSMNNKEGGSSRLSTDEAKITPKHAAVEQKFTSVHIQEQPKDMCNIFKNRKGKSSISGHPSQSPHKSNPMACKVAVPTSSICHSLLATENQQNISAEKHMYVMSLSTPLVHFL